MRYVRNALLLASFACCAAAAGPGSATPASDSRTAEARSTRVYHLGSMTVTGNSSKTKILCAFRSMFLTQFSPDPAKADAVICRTTPITGSHFKRIWCLTNRQYFQAKHAGPRAAYPVFVVHGLNDAGVQPVSARAIKRLIANPQVATICKQYASE